MGDLDDPALGEDLGLEKLLELPKPLLKQIQENKKGMLVQRGC